MNYDLAEQHAAEIARHAEPAPAPTDLLTDAAPLLSLLSGLAILLLIAGPSL